MKMKRRLTGVCILMSVIALGFYALAEPAVDPEDVDDAQEEVVQTGPPTLTKQGEMLEAKYSGILSSLSKEVSDKVLQIDEGKKKALLLTHAVIASLQEPGKEDSADIRTKYNKDRAQADSNALVIARSVLADIDGFLSSHALDDKLMTIAVISDATPRGLAEFGQQGKEEEALLEKLFSNKELMKQMLVAGGANGGEWGEAMQVYESILAKSERAREVGTIFQRLALGTALQQPWLPGKQAGGVYGISHADSSIPGSQADRYMHYENAYLAGELDPAFKEFNPWECRFITNDPYTNEELAWTREMLRNYRPDHITNPDYKWRYAAMVKSDVPYASPDWRPNEGTTRVQQIIAGGGKCGPRAFFGRTVCRAFGIPSRRSTQSGHAAMNHWTPDGWAVVFGAWWSWNWAGPWGGLDFLLESQAREYPEEFMKVLRAQWVGDALGEEDVSIRHYGKGGGLWNALAFYKKRAVVEDARIAALNAELLELSGDEGRLLGESDNILGDVEKDPGYQIPEEHKKIILAEDGTITFPAVACVDPTNGTDRILFMASCDGKGSQVHYTRLGKRPELLKYYIEAPKDGKYSLTMDVVTVGRDQSCMLRLNRRTMINLDLPSTWGLWGETKPVDIDLKQGRNTLMFTCEPPNRGVSIKSFTLTPMK